MKYKKMVVWSGGDKNAKTAKINTIGYSLCFVMFCILHVMAFICPLSDDKNTSVALGDHILFGTMILLLSWWLTALMLFAAKSSLKDIKKNKLIPLYLYDIDNFAKIGEIPEDKFVLFSSQDGVVLAEKQYKDESETFSFGAKYFFEFTNYYDKHAVEREVIEWN